MRTHISLRASQSVFPEEQGDDRGSHGTMCLFQHQHFPGSRSRRGAGRILVYEHACRSGLSSRADRDLPWRMYCDSILGDRAISRAPATTKPQCRAANTEALSLSYLTLVVWMRPNAWRDQIYRRVATTAKRCFAGNVGAYASFAVDSELYSELGYGELTLFSNQHRDAKLLPFSPGRKAALARKREVQISCAWLGWRRPELPAI